MGWAVLEGEKGAPPVYFDSGIAGILKGDKEKDQAYRLRLIDFWSVRGFEMLETYEPELVAFETLPLVGGAGFSGNVQSKLVATAVTALQTVCSIHGTPVVQIAAVTVKARLGGGKSATKVKVRDGVILQLPVLAPRRMEWTESKKAMDEPDALGVGLIALGYSNKR